MYSTPVDLSFSYLRSAVEASLDTKKVHMEPNNICENISMYMRSCKYMERIDKEVFLFATQRALNCFYRGRRFFAVYDLAPPLPLPVSKLSLSQSSFVSRRSILLTGEVGRGGGGANYKMARKPGPP
jgi:hypothetical protein